jgi:hypothetical protein
MDTKFTLIVTLQLPESKLDYGKFAVGNEIHVARNIFSMLKGRREAVPGYHIKIELVEEILSLPVTLDSLYCCLEELKENVAVISKEILRHAVLESGNPAAFQL